MTSGKVLLGALAGVAIGAAAGILLAPESGAATRKKISKKGNGYASELGDKFNELVDGMTQKFEAMMAEATHKVENGKSRAENALAEVSNSAKAKMNELK